MQLHESILNAVDLNYFDRLFAKLAGRDYEFAICSPQHFPLWTSNGRGKRMMAKVINHVKEKNGFHAPVDRNKSGRIDLAGSKTLLFSPFLFADGNTTGWVMALGQSLDADKKDSSADDIMSALEDIASGIERECRLNRELDGMAQELADRYEELNLVYNLSRSMNPSEASSVIYRHFMQLAIDYMDVAASIFVDRENMTPICTVGVPDSVAGVDFFANQVRGSLFHFVCAIQRNVIVNDPEDPRRSFLCPHLDHKILAEPVIFENKVEAVLLLLRRNDQVDFSNSDQKLARVMAEQIGILMRNRSMYKAMHMFNEQMASAMIEAVDAKDPYTRGHSDRVTRFSVKIGKHIGLDESEITPLYWAALLHDVGKIGVPDVVLSKPTRLSPDENILVRIHPERGYNILRNVDHLQSSLSGVRHHHENFDGSGYPHNLKGRVIPLQARIIAVADTFDAMTSSRAYRPALSFDTAMTEIKRVSGVQLDPDLVQAWIELMDDQAESQKERPPEEERRNG